MPSIVNTTDRNGKNPMIMIPAKSYEQPSLAYIDLDLPPKDDDVFPTPAPVSKVPQSNESSTIYKTVDFEMTKAFNQTRKDVEEKRQHDKTATEPRQNKTLT